MYAPCSLVAEPDREVGGGKEGRKNKKMTEKQKQADNNGT